MTNGSHPARIGRYEIRGVLGRGAMGVVYRGYDPAIDRGVAIKLLTGALIRAEGAEDAMERLRSEARAAGCCLHQNIVGLFDLALHDAAPFLVMEMVEGCDLAAALHRAGGKLARGDAIAIVLQVLAALQAAHREGVIHRDIKPSNILLDRHGRAKVSDFGVSILKRGRDCASGVIAGTPSYMSPEQCRGAATDERSDLFSIGVLLHELLLGRRPFAGGSPAAVMEAIQRAAPEIPPGGEGLAPDLRAVILRSLTKAPEERFPSATAMAAALRACAEEAAPDATIMAAPELATAPPPGSIVLPEETMLRIQHMLSRHIGPIAGHLLQRAMRHSGDPDALAAMLATHIEEVAARERFSHEARSVLRQALPPAKAHQAGGNSLPPKEVDALLRSLSSRLGPIARVVLEAERPGAVSMATLWTRTAQHLDSPEERRRYLLERPAPRA